MIAFTKLDSFVSNLNVRSIPIERKAVLQPLIDYIQDKFDRGLDIRLTFICTHNSRRSHLAQVWAQTLASFLEVKNVFTYSGGTEATALYPQVAFTLEQCGFEIYTLSAQENPIYAIKPAEVSNPIICFSKNYSDWFNPQSDFAAILVCNQADEACPIVEGAEKRIAIPYADPKEFDNTPSEAEHYLKRSLQIATELYYVFSSIGEGREEVRSKI